MILDVGFQPKESSSMNNTIVLTLQKLSALRTDFKITCMQFALAQLTSSTTGKNIKPFSLCLKKPILKTSMSS